MSSNNNVLRARLSFDAGSALPIGGPMLDAGIPLARQRSMTMQFANGQLRVDFVDTNRVAHRIVIPANQVLYVEMEQS